MKALLLIISLTVAVYGYSQQTNPDPQPDRRSTLKEVENTLPETGTYQIILKDKRIISKVTQEDLLKVNALRKEDQTTFLTVDPYTRIKILSKKEIESADFTPLKKYYYEK